MLKELDKKVRLSKPYPNKIIIGEKAFEKLKKEMHETFAIGLKVNLKGEYTSLWGMQIEIDKTNPNRVDLITNNIDK